MKLLSQKFSRILLYLLLSPIIVPFANIYRLLLTYKNSRVLLSGQFSDYNRFHPVNALNSLFYWTEALNLSRFGRNGISPFLSLGNYHLSNWWFNTSLSLILYWRLGSAFNLICMHVWLIICGPLLHNNLSIHQVVLLLLTLFSSYFYGATFVFLNYNALGWALFPLALHYMLQGNFVAAALIWFCISFASVTVLAVGIAISFALSIASFEPLLLLATLPSFLRIVSHLSYSSNLFSSISSIAAGIGINKSSSSGVKYKRNKLSDLLSPRFISYILSWTSFSVVLSILFPNNNEYIVLSLSALLLALLNASLVRFADLQSMYMSSFTIGLLACLKYQSLTLSVLFTICIYVPPLLLGTTSYRERFYLPRPLSPFYIKSVLQKVSQFLAPVSNNSRVLLSLKDPLGSYSNLHDGYRSIYESLFYTANLKNIHVFPDLWCIYDNNSVDSPGFWGTNPNICETNMNTFAANYLLVYQPSASTLEPNWLTYGFSLVSELDWGDILTNDLDGISCWGEQPNPKWFLLTLNNNDH